MANRWLVGLAVVVPVILLGAAVVAVIADWQEGAGEISMLGMFALAGAAVFSLALTVALVVLMIYSNRRGLDDDVGLPSDEMDRKRREEVIRR